MTISLQLLRLRLDGGDQDWLCALFPAAGGDIELIVDELELSGTIRLPGRNVSIVTRTLVIHDATAVIDVSGGPADPSFDIEADQAASGTAQAPDGHPGAAGGHGNRGGNVTLTCDRITGALVIRSNGSDGGNSQRGGNGAQPAIGHGADGAFIDNKEPTTGHHGGGSLQGKKWGDTYVRWAAGQAGANAKNGGNAGSPGQPGDGGDAGKVSVRGVWSKNGSISIEANPGSPGQAGQPATPGKPCVPGNGGRNRLYWKYVNSANEFIEGSKDKWVKHYAGRYGIPARAPNGTGTGVPGLVPEQPRGSAGESSEAEIDTTGAASTVDLYPSEFLALLKQRDSAVATSR